ncbi:chromate efflux transporter [Nocardioides sp. YIM 152588]|uniref:chromate efflux transporter n=1 Tax=Nocardioides sp. YIM 152588 TaxID=3158259 RepID=UPI0032E4976E
MEQSPPGRPGVPGSAREVAGVFLRLGLVAFGGPAAHVALMREELVRRRAWVDDRRFLDLVAATNLIPGPNSTELAIHLGHDRARWRGLVVAGACFILPAAFLVAGLAWAYVEYGDTPALTGLLYGVVPVMLAIVAWAVIGLAPTVFSAVRWVVLAALALTAYLLGVNELVVLFGGGAVAALMHAAGRLRADGTAALVAPLLAAPALGQPDPDRYAQLFWSMLRIGAVLYGSGYVLITFLDGEFVDRLGWITTEQLVDAVSVGQVTPGPVFTTATFVGYLVAGWPGAVIATVAIFLPSFVFVGLLTRLTGWLRSRPWTAAVLDGLSTAAVALMVGVFGRLAREGLVDVLTVALFAVTLLGLWRTRLNSAWFIAGGAVVGLATAGW